MPLQDPTEIDAQTLLADVIGEAEIEPEEVNRPLIFRSQHGRRLHHKEIQTLLETDNFDRDVTVAPETETGLTHETIISRMEALNRNESITIEYEGYLLFSESEDDDINDDGCKVIISRIIIKNVLSDPVDEQTQDFTEESLYEYISENAVESVQVTGDNDSKLQIDINAEGTFYE